MRGTVFRDISRANFLKIIKNIKKFKELQFYDDFATKIPLFGNFFSGNFLSKNNAWFLSVEFHPIFNSWFPYKTVNFHEIFDSTEIRLDGNLAKFKRNLSEFFLHFEPQKFNLCDSVSKKVRISYTFFRILTKFSWNLWISLKLDQFWKLWIK